MDRKMKKLKIKAKEIRRLGYADDKAARLALKLAQLNYKHDQKLIVLGILEDLQIDPEKYLHHEYFAELAGLLLSKKNITKTAQPKNTILRKTGAEFKIFGTNLIDPEALEQMYTAMKMPVVVKGALMADAHVGYGLPIGGVVAAYNAVMPYGVGMDIACRMCLSVYPDPPEILRSQKENLKQILIENTRFGLAEFSDIGDHELMERDEWKEIKFLHSLKDVFYSQLGTSGHGNHFVDMGYLVVKEFTEELGLQPGEYFAILSHSGSRNFGAEAAKHYTDVAKKKLGLSGEAGQLAWLDLNSEEGQEYWKVMSLAGDYSAANHKIIHQKLSSSLHSKPLKTIENHHNFAWQEKLSEHESLIIHRKGATPAHPGDVGIIPGNMVSPAFIVSGKGNETSLFSASHGAGRQISRNKAKQTFSKIQLKKILEKEGVELIGGATDESPMAYKDIHHVMDAQKELVNVLAAFYPKIVRME
jgi:tRNA-splicing ligase RtcB (3'-phosphate/5'-hydroxy nucleic acid ligase)